MKPRYSDLNHLGFCTTPAYPSHDGKKHSEDELLKQVKRLKDRYNNDARGQYKTTHYDIFLFSSNSPCPRCAENIVETVKDINSDVLFDGWYISYNQEYMHQGESTLPKTKEIIEEYNNSLDTVKKRITILPEYRPLKRIL